MNYRNRDLLDTSYGIDCTVGLPCCTGGPGEPAHSNSQIFGKGGAMKAHDFAFASSCRECHRELDQGKTMDKEQKFFVWLHAYVETQRQLWERGFLHAEKTRGKS